MSELKVGDRIRDNDPRMGDRLLTIIDLGLKDQLRAVDSIGMVRWYAKRRVFTDGKPRRTGFSLVREGIG